MGKLDGKVAIVTGGGSGFGKSTSILWAQEGAKVVVADIVVEGAEATVKEIVDGSGEAIFTNVDVSKAEDSQKMVKTAVDNYGRLDILFNNAGILGPRGVMTADLKEEDAEKLININFKGVYLGTKYAIPEMIKSGGGSIITTGSDSAFLGNRGLSVYSATKGAVLAFSRVVAMEYVKQGIRANTVSPGAGQTPMHAELIDHDKQAWKEVENSIPMGRAAYAEDVAKAALFFASDDSKYITGANLMVDGGWTVKGF